MPSACPPDENSNAQARPLRPGAITRITRRRRDRGQFAIEIDGQPGLTLTEEVLVRSGLQAGDTIDEETLGELLAQDGLARATEAALGFLAYRPRSEREVRDRLRRSDFAPGTIDQVIARLYEWRYLDDADFARRWVESRASARPRGERLLQRELRQKGIDAETAREAIAEAGLDEVAAAEELARRRLSAYAGEDPRVVRRRLGAYLARRGYGFDVVRAALERAMGTPDEEDGASAIPEE